MDKLTVKDRGVTQQLLVIPGGMISNDLEAMSYRISSNIPKRLIDICISFCVIVFVMSWFYPLVWLLIRLTSKGSVLFKQKRIGYRGGVFFCYKFRTMTVDAPNTGFTPTSQNDKRVTLIGKFLRKANLDELPQIFNVLLGDMSIVGPRPHPIAFHNTYASFVDDIDLRLLVKPGITGLAQVKGYRGDVMDMEENKKRVTLRIKYDIEYIKTWSLKYDLYLMFKTGWQMVIKETKGY